MKPPSKIPRIVMHDCRHSRWLSFSSPVALFSTSEPAEVTSLLHEIDRTVQTEKLWAAGWISYEASAGFDSSMKVQPNQSGFPLVWMALFQSLENMEPNFPIIGKNSGPHLHWVPMVGTQEYGQAIQSIRRYIAAGDTYQVNYTYRLAAECPYDPWAVWQSLLRSQPGGYAALIETDDWAVCSASPELFFEQEGDRLLSRPMKGTYPRGKTLEEDVLAAETLQQCKKNRAENIMIVDMVRNDMGRIAVPGSVKAPSLFHVERYPTLHQMTSTVECQTHAPFSEIMGALFPAASITGAPKIRTMEIIRELESSPREIYTGTLGFISPDRCAQWNVAIRTAWIDKKEKKAYYGTGGGIVWDSSEQNELEESLLKTRILHSPPPPRFDLLETMLWTPDAGYFLLDEHLQRLKNSADYFDRPVDIKMVRSELLQRATDYSKEDQRIRVCVDPKGKIKIDVQRLDPLPCPYTVCLADEPVCSDHIFLYHKTTQRSIYERAQQKHPDVHDVLLWNESGLLTEFCIANVIMEIDGRWYTPPVSSGLLPGVYRQHLLKTGQIEEKELTIEDLQRCTSIAAVNSVRKTIAVKIEI